LFQPERLDLSRRCECCHRDIEDLLAERGVTVSHESIRLWCNKFGPKYAVRLKQKRDGYGDTFHIDEVFVKINGEFHYLWLAVDQDGDVVDVLLQSRRDGQAAKRFFKRLLTSHGREARKIVTDKLRSYDVAHRDLMLETIHDNAQYANNRAELSNQPTRVRERQMRRFKSSRQAQRFLNAHAVVYTLFNLGRHLIGAEHYRNLREGALSDWRAAAV
tara:strand:+ start:84 stop:734 length:651 start_codon:yes stop_codon:yes gene_type:complete